MRLFVYLFSVDSHQQRVRLPVIWRFFQRGHMLSSWSIILAVSNDEVEVRERGFSCLIWAPFRISDTPSSENVGRAWKARTAPAWESFDHICPAKQSHRSITCFRLGFSSLLTFSSHQNQAKNARTTAYTRHELCRIARIHFWYPSLHFAKGSLKLLASISIPILHIIANTSHNDSKDNQWHTYRDERSISKEGSWYDFIL